MNTRGFRTFSGTFSFPSYLFPVFPSHYKVPRYFQSYIYIPPSERVISSHIYIPPPSERLEYLCPFSRVSVQSHTTPPQNARQCTRPRSREMKGKHFSCAIGIAMTSIQTATTSCTGYCNTEIQRQPRAILGHPGPRTAHRQVDAAAVAAVGYGRGTCSLVASCPIRDLGQTNQPPACRWRRQHACSADAPCANSRTLSQPWSSKLSTRPRIAASWRGTF